MPELNRAIVPPSNNRYDFQPAWQEARISCEKLLRWDAHSELRGNALLAFQAQCYSKIYRLVSSPANGVPGLVKNDNEQVSAPDAEGTQVLVLYYLLREMLKVHLEHYVRPNLKLDLGLLDSYVTEWRKYSVGLDLVASSFRFLHSHWSKKDLPPGHVTMSTRSLGLMLWGDHIIAGNREPIKEAILREIQSDRRMSQSGNIALVRQVLMTFDQLCSHDPRRHQAYSEVFESPLLNDLQSSYRQCVVDLGMRSCTNGEYLAKATSWFAEESKRFESITSGRSGLAQNARRQLTIVLVEEPVPSGRVLDAFKEHIAKTDDESLTVIERVFSLARGSELVVHRMCEALDQIVKDYFQNELEQRKAEVDKELSPNQPEPRGSALVECVLCTYRPFAEAVRRFDKGQEVQRHSKLRAALHMSLQEAIMKKSPTVPSIRFAESLARFCNTLLRNNKKDDQEKETALHEAVELLEFISERDVFSHCYQHFLSQRLITASSASANPTEEFAINQFRKMWGREFSYRWERMYHDATQLRAEYQKLAESSSGADGRSGSRAAIELCPQILTAAWWPLRIDEPPMTLSGDVGALLSRFEAAYRELHCNRSLRWSLQHSHAVVNCQFGKILYTFTVSPYQWEILHLFNQALDEFQSQQQQSAVGGSGGASSSSSSSSFPSVSYQAIQQRTKQSTEILQRALFELINRGLLLSVDAQEKDISKQVYRVNLNFSSDNRKVQFLVSTQRRVEQGGTSSAAGGPAANGGFPPVSAASQQAVNERRFAIQAAIVRSVKTRRMATYGQIVEDVEAALSRHGITTTPKDIKVNLEQMIEKEYVERSPDNPSVFHYWA